MIVKWNVTRTVRRYTDPDVIVLSVGKSGRTWLRVLLNKYFSLAYHIPFSLENLRKYSEETPSISYSHEIWKHYTEATLDQRLRGKFIAPDKILFNKKVILMYRDPRDVVVSLYYQKTKRSKNKIECNISDFIKHKKYGIYNIVNVMNKWYQRLKNHPACLWLSYEDMKIDTFGVLIKTLKFIDIESVDAAIAREAVAFANFENMKKLEAKGEFKRDILKSADPEDKNSFKVREGKVGGYKKHFSESDLEYLENALHKLDNFYRYKPNVL